MCRPTYISRVNRLSGINQAHPNTKVAEESELPSFTSNLTSAVVGLCSLTAMMLEVLGFEPTCFADMNLYGSRVHMDGTPPARNRAGEIKKRGRAMAQEAKGANVKAGAEALKHGAEDKPARLTDDELLVKHYPRYFYDKREKHFPVDLNRYAASASASCASACACECVCVCCRVSRWLLVSVSCSVLWLTGR